MSKTPQRDPIQAYQRSATAARRVGKDKQCACGEKRPEALIAGSNPLICASCKRQMEGKRAMDYHHPAGRANNPATIAEPVNDHRAILNVAQHDWPRQTLQNPNGCPALAAAACVRGVIDYLHYLIDKFLAWIPQMLEALSAFLQDKLGPKWWLSTPLAQFAPKS